MKQRILTGSAMVAFLILLFISKSNTTYIFDAFVVLLGIVAGYEISKLLTKIGFYNSKWSIVLYPIFAYALFIFAMYKQLSLKLILVLEVALVIFISGLVSFLCLILKKRTDNEIKTRKLNIKNEKFSLFKGIQTLFGLLYPGFILLALLIINNVQNLNYTLSLSGSGYYVSMFFLIYVFLIPMFVDTFAMLTGMIFKGKKLCEKISPKKTISGAVGGVVWGVACAIAMYFIFNSIDSFRLLFISLNLKWWMVLIAGLISSVVCQVGDVFESYIKRKANVKDSGDILPGHGGILDRIDSHLANMIVAVIFMLIII